MEFDTRPINRCSKRNEKIYQDWFNGDGRLIGKDVTNFLAMSNLPREDLKQVWAIADSKRQGFLGFKEFITAMQLVSLAQVGHALTSDSLNAEVRTFQSNAVDFENLQLPKMEGLDGLLSKKKRVAKWTPDHNGSLSLSSRANWFSSSKSAKKVPSDYVTSIIDGLKKLYVKKLKPLEVTYHFNDFVSPLLANSDFDAKPMVMLLGQYSTGKTTFIKHLLRTSYPGAHIGPEPTTDRFVVVMLMRVYGALMWSLGKVLNTPEVSRVYIGSFNDIPINEDLTWPLGKELFEKEQDDLLTDLKNIPKKACDRRINEFVKRARAAKIHAYIISHLKKEMPAMMGKAKTQKRLMDNLENEFVKVSVTPYSLTLYRLITMLLGLFKNVDACCMSNPPKLKKNTHLPAGDFPNVEHFREVLNGYNIDKFEKLKPKLIQAVDDMLGYDIPELLKNFKNPYD
ncbi:hypothetical protein RND71_034680 [Anisodus tanguticus]|uniref:Uncharacterized protein n=1 Tax=Anisodus tanguticus TaxID=243964 RepID=A0AAE1R2N1_9SOLA|nr:hypothetical protein RND71_034680 [Anisodus tanguticus]